MDMGNTYMQNHLMFPGRLLNEYNTSYTSFTKLTRAFSFSPAFDIFLEATISNATKIS